MESTSPIPSTPSDPTQLMILKRIEEVLVIQNQQAITLSEILINLKAQNTAPVIKPEEMPDFPLTSLEAFSHLEECLKQEKCFDYLVSIFIRNDL